MTLAHGYNRKTLDRPSCYGSSLPCFSYTPTSRKPRDRIRARMEAVEPSLDVGSGPETGFERADAVLNALVINPGDRGRVGGGGRTGGHSDILATTMDSVVSLTAFRRIKC